MAVTPETIEAFLLGEALLPDQVAEIEQQLGVVGSTASIISRRMAKASRASFDPDGPLIGIEPPPELQHRFDELTQLRSQLGELRRQRAFDEALPLAEVICRLTMRYLGEEHGDTGIAINGLAKLAYEVGDYFRAAHVYEQAVSFRSRYQGERHSDTAISLGGLGRTMEAVGFYDISMDCHRSALSIMEESLGENHPDTIVHVNDLASVLTTQGELQEAQRLFQRSLDFYADFEGNTSRNFAVTTGNLGRILESLGLHTDARTRFEDCLYVLQYQPEPDDVDLVWAMSNLANSMLLTGDPEGAQEQLEEALTFPMYDDLASRVELAALQSNLGVTLFLNGEGERAADRLRTAVELFEEEFGEDHPTTISAQLNLARVTAAVADEQRLKEKALGIKTTQFAIADEQTIGVWNATIEGNLIPLLLLAAA